MPARSGAKLREYHFLRALGRSADVSYAYFADPGAAPLSTGDLPFCRDVIAVPKPAAYTPVKVLRGLFGKWPLPILNYTSAAMDAEVARLTEVRDFDIVHADSIHMVRYARAAVHRRPGLKAIYNWHNIESEAMLRYSLNTASGARRRYAAFTAGKLQALERSILTSDFGHVVCSERERDQLGAIAPDARIAVVGNGVDTAYFAGCGEGTSARPRVVFVGAMDYAPNADGAIFFAKQVWPAVRQRLGEAELTIVGANPGPAVRALGELPGVTVTGIVPDVRPYYGGALAAVVPLRTGGGTRLKILEAMAAGIPVVSTPIGAEGLEVSDGENCLLVEPDDVTGWTRHLTELAASPLRRAQMTEAGLHLVKTRYDWETLGAQLRDIYRGWLSL